VELIDHPVYRYHGDGRAFSAGACIMHSTLHGRPRRGVAHFMRPGHRMTDAWDPSQAYYCCGKRQGSVVDASWWSPPHRARGGDGLLLEAEVNIGIIPHSAAHNGCPKRRPEGCHELILTGRIFEQPRRHVLV
jgi:hypothetical protein